MPRKPPKPEGFNEFDALIRKLVQVPKKEVDRRMARAAAKKAKKKK